MKTPVLFLIFNRPEETERVFQVIREIAPKYLYISADGPRAGKQGEEELCQRVRDIVRNVDWPCNVKTIFREKNSGCKKAVSDAINWFFAQEEQGIILEDDCLPDPSFFPYCEQLLEKYKNDESIISISGTNLGYQFPNDSSYGFSKFMNMWGWATWRRSAILVDYEMKEWKRKTFKSLFLHNKLQKNVLYLDYNWVKFWKNYFNLTASGELDTWDYQWIYVQLKNNLRSIFPAKNLIQNIGFNRNATHTINSNDTIGKLALESMNSPITDPENYSNNLFYEENYIKRVWFPYQKDSIYRILRSKFLNNANVAKVINQLKGKNGI